jgi:hypothetical protein
MQNRYVSDIGDYLKLGILRALSPRYRLGVAWWPYPDEDHNGNGGTSATSTDLISGDASIPTCSTASARSWRPAREMSGHSKRPTFSPAPCSPVT